MDLNRSHQSLYLSPFKPNTRNVIFIKEIKEYLQKIILLDSSLNAVRTVQHLDRGHILDICEISDPLVINLSLLWSL
jgi:hypothetical protein